MDQRISITNLASSKLSTEIDEALDSLEINQVKPIKPLFYVISSGKRTYLYLQIAIPNKRMLALLGLILGAGGLGWIADTLKLL